MLSIITTFVVGFILGVACALIVASLFMAD